jgi:PhzF family phenazine biosynthesis protein
VSYVDVFGDVPLGGNPVAVVHNADDLTDEQMAAFARWTNLSETTFLLAPCVPAADYRLRIFTPGGELPFAGHPTLGSCFAWLEAGGHPQHVGLVVQECDIGSIDIRSTAGRLAFAAPPLLRTGPLEPELLQRLLQALNLPADAVRAHQWVDNGPGWCALLLDSAERVRQVVPNYSAMSGLALGLVGPCSPSQDCDFELRAFVPDMGVPEDPVTGSLNAGVAQWLIREGLAPARYLASQGGCIGRSGRIYIESDGGQIWVGGTTRRVVVGTMALETSRSD